MPGSSNSEGTKEDTRGRLGLEVARLGRHEISSGCHRHKIIDVGRIDQQADVTVSVTAGHQLSCARRVGYVVDVAVVGQLVHSQDMADHVTAQAFNIKRRQRCRAFQRIQNKSKPRPVVVHAYLAPGRGLSGGDTAGGGEVPDRSEGIDQLRC